MEKEKDIRKIEKKYMRRIKAIDKYNIFILYTILFLGLLFTCIFEYTFLPIIIDFMVFIVYTVISYGYRRYLRIKLINIYNPSRLAEKNLFGRKLKKKERKKFVEETKKFFEEGDD